MKHNNTWCKIIEPGTQICLIQHHTRVSTRWRSTEVTANFPLSMVFILKDRGLVGLSQIVVISCEIWPAWIPNDLLCSLLYIMQCNIVKYPKTHIYNNVRGEKSITVHLFKSVLSYNEYN